MFSIVNIVGHIAQAVYAFGSSFKNHIYLRASLVIGGFIELYYDYNISSEPLWPMLIWSVVIIVINLFQLVRFYYEKSNLKFTDEEKSLYSNVFHKMEILNFKRLMRAGKWKFLDSDEIIIVENQKSEKLHLLFEGIAEVNVNGKAVSIIKEGNFIGEMSFLTGNLPTATVKTITGARIIEWERETIKKMINENPDFQTELNSIFSTDLILKLALQNNK